MTVPQATRPPLGRTDLSHRRPAPFDRFWFGACYYPEHWDEATRKEDPARMAAAGFNLVRMAEFAWDRMEPEEGRFDFSFFDAEIERLAGAGIATLLCTPTAAPPRWLTESYPEVLRVDADGRPMTHGSRQHCDHAHPHFQTLSRTIVRAMAEHFRDNPHVVGWQTDNEFHCHFSETHADAAREAFQAWLGARYEDDIDALNRAWGNAFWALTYDRFDQIPTPRYDRPTHPNPSHVLDYYRFLSDTVTEFQRQQVAILREVQPRWWITHNGCFGHIDYRGRFTHDLDLLGWDCYPFFTADPDLRPLTHAFAADRARGWSGNFIVPEQQSGPGGQQPYFHDHPEPGELRKCNYVSLAHGADALLHFRWRTCRFGAEEYWCGVLDHDDVPRRRYDEVRRFGEEMKRIGPELLGTHVVIDAAVAGPDMAVEEGHGTYHLGLPYPGQVSRWVHADLFLRGVAVGLVHPEDDLDGLRLYVVPHWQHLDPAWVAPLLAFVEGGGLLVVGARTGTRTPDNQVIAATPPGALAELTGVTVAEYGRQNCPEKRPLHLRVGEKKKVLTDLWYERLDLGEGVRALATWRDRHLEGTPAVSVRKVGKGQVVYVGTYLTEAVTARLMPELMRRAKLKAAWPGLPKGVEAVRRADAEKTLWFFINHRDRRVPLPTTPRGTDLLTETEAGDARTLEAFGVAVIREPRG